MKNNDKLNLQYPVELIEKCIDLLNNFAENSEMLTELSAEQRIALLTAAGKLSRPDRDELMKRRRNVKKIRRRQDSEGDRQARASTGIRAARTESIFKAPKQIVGETHQPQAKVLSSPRNCYVCKTPFTTLHFFYDSMCKECGDFNYAKRFQTAPLDGQVALITGSRLKIGYRAALMMMRAGATVIATTRFPVDSAHRYAAEDDFAEWGDRLHIYGLDLRHTPSVEIFARFIEQTYQRLDLLINNAAQTVRRPSGFYGHLMERENAVFATLPEQVQSLLRKHESCKEQLVLLSGEKSKNDKNLPVIWNTSGPGVGIRASAQLSQIPYRFDSSLDPDSAFPQGELDADLQQIDLRKINSWRLRIGEIDTPEMLEVQLVNAVAPFVLCNRLSTMMRRDYTGTKHIVNVTAMEGKFHRFRKADRHPHTNMAKAALNMLTHTSASDLARDGIYMNAVDTGWVTDEDPADLASFKQETHDFQPQLDIVDGAARICDPFFDGILTGQHWCGKFLKDYKPIDW